jgi:di/tricarboxylate transporter
LSDSTIVFLVLGGVVVLFVSNRVPVELTAIGAALVLYFTDVLSLEQTLAGFGDSTVVFIASLFVVSEGLEAAGVTAWAGQQLMERTGGSRARLVVLMMLLVALMSALITPNGAVAALVPVVVVLAIRIGRAPSELLLPLSFASFGGALLVLTGSPVNVIIAEASKDAGAGGFGYLEFAIVGVPLLAGTIAIALALGPRLLPERRPRTMPPDFSQHARALLAQYSLGGPITRLRVGPDSPFVGKTRAEVDLRRYPGVEAIAAQEGEAGAPVARPVLAAGDVLAVRGERDIVSRMARENGLTEVSTAPFFTEDEGVYTRDSGVVEVVIPPRSEAIGETVFPGLVTESGDLVILAVQRGGEDRAGKTILAAGDTLLLQGRWEALDGSLEDRRLLVVDAPDQIRRQIVPLGARAGVAIAVLAGMVILLATGLTPPAVAGLLAACALVLLRVVTVQQAYRSISWTVVILIGAMIPLATAMTQSGAASDVADSLVAVVGDGSPYLLLIALFVLVALLGQLISNTATALIVIPVAVAAALELDVSVQPIFMAVNVAAHASFLTPVATTPNLMVLEPGGYRFSDYWKFGLPLLLLYFLVAITIVPLVWRF